jgi:hypothetical protein
MNPVLVGVLMVTASAIVGVVLAARSGLLRSVVGQQTCTSLDLKHPLVIELSEELRVLDALPISTKSERKDWEAARRVFDKKLRTVWSSIYDSLPHELEHYLGDVDIRAKDPVYAQHQRRQLAALLTVPHEKPKQSPEPTPPSGVAHLKR